MIVESFLGAERRLLDIISGIARILAFLPFSWPKKIDSSLFDP